MEGRQPLLALLRLAVLPLTVQAGPRLRVSRSASAASRDELALLQTTSPRPNIVWLMADDLGYGEVGATFKGDESRRIDTPNLDKLGSDGIFFRQAYTGYTVCAPSRTAFFTGRHAGSFWKHGLDGENIPAELGQNTLAMLLHDVGYRTGGFGKISPLVDPEKTGFDRFVGQIDQNICHNMYPKWIDEGAGKFNFWIGNEHAERPSRENCQKVPSRYNYTIDVFHQAAMEWLNKVANEKDPFFLYMGYTIPHAGGWDDMPLDSVRGQPVPQTFRYEEKDWPDVEKDHAASVTYLDLKVGHVMQRLKELGVDDNTLVFFASDNGAHVEGGHQGEFFHSSGGLRGQKRSLFEGGVRTPTMARWPAGIKAGQVSDFAWAFWDVLPTFTELAGAETPLGLDGVSIVPTLRGEKQDDKDYLFFSWRTRTASNGVPDDGPTVLLQTSRKTQKAERLTAAALMAQAAEQEYNSSAAILSRRARQRKRRQMKWKKEAKKYLSLYEHARTQAKQNVMAYSIRKGNWKGVVSVCKDSTPQMDDVMELYDLSVDPSEEKNVAGERKKVVHMLKKLVVSEELSCSCFQCDWPAP